MNAKNLQIDNESDKIVQKVIGTNLKYKHDINWPVLNIVIVLHIFSLWGLIAILNGEVQIKTLMWCGFLWVVSYMGTSIGSHRYYSHKSFKATTLLEVILIIMQTVAGEYHIYSWCKDHRQHHRYSDTDGDPHNVKRGFFFCHVGWVITKRNKYVTELSRKVNMRDLNSNKLIMFQKRYYLSLFLLFSVIIPVVIPVYFFQETWWNSLLVSYFVRQILHLHHVWAVVYFGHAFGTRPYNKYIQPVESWMLGILSGGDGNHNFHHVFPWDYKTAEGPNFMSLFILLCKYLGLAEDLKVAPKDMVKDKVLKNGDGTHTVYGTDEGMSTVTAIGPMHPLNPTYRSKTNPDVVTKIYVKENGMN